MQPEHRCSAKKDKTYRYHRMHYCGTCKVMGKQYGQKSRLTLNFDTVFLAELLSQLANEGTASWASSFQAINHCFTLPKSTDQSPKSLQYAATCNVLLSELKINDHIHDHGQKRWKIANWFLSKPFKKASKQLENWGIDSQFFGDWAKTQNQLEQAPQPQVTNLSEQLKHYANPTAQMTATLFAQASQVLNLTQENISDKLYQLGHAFGQLAYSLDAFEDLEKDIVQAQFNPLVSWFGTNQTLHTQQLAETQKLILAQKENVTNCLQNLGLTEDWIAVYAGRLTTNVASILYKERTIPISVKQRIKNRWTEAQNTAQRLSCQPTNLAKKLQFQFFSVAVFVAPQVAEPLQQSDKGMIWKWMAIVSTLLATTGLIFKRVPKGRVRCIGDCIEDCCNKCLGFMLFMLLICLAIALLVSCIFLFITGPLWAAILMLCLGIASVVGALLIYGSIIDPY